MDPVIEVADPCFFGLKALAVPMKGTTSMG